MSVPLFDHETQRPRRARRPAPDWGGDDVFDQVPRRRFAPTGDVVVADPARRTVTITGHPDRVAVARRERGPRTVGERIGARPDRLAAWACVLGVLLVLIALLS